jgi:hypothetical protein
VFSRVHCSLFNDLVMNFVALSCAISFVRLLHVNRTGTFSVMNTNYFCYLKNEISSFFPLYSGIVIRCACSLRESVSLYRRLFQFSIGALYSCSLLIYCFATLVSAEAMRHTM